MADQDGFCVQESDSSTSLLRHKSRNDPTTDVASALAQSTRHLGLSRQYWRDIILGVNDGLISTFLLVVGVAGGGFSSQDIFLTAVSGALAGAISMCAGEYVATKSQNEVMAGEIQLEHQHIRYCLQEELEELGDLLRLIGIAPEEAELRASLLQYYKARPDSLLQIMAALEFGVLDQEQRSPVLAGVTSCLLFLLGSLPSTLPFAFSGDYPGLRLSAAILLTTLSLLTVGAVKTWATRGSCLQASVENLAIAGLGGVLAYGIGSLFDQVLHERAV